MSAALTILIVIARIAGWILTVAAAFILLVLFCPFRYRLRVSKADRLRLDMRATWLFGLVGVRITGDSAVIRLLFVRIKLRLGEGKAKKTRKQEKAGKSDDPEKPEKAGIFGKLRAGFGMVQAYGAVWRDFGMKLTLLEKLWLTLKRLGKAVIPKRLELTRARAGFGDPARTGWLLGAVYIYNAFSPFPVSFEADFGGENVEFDARAAGTIALWRFVWPLAAFCLSRPFLRIAGGVLNVRKELARQ
ncbi:MAG: hypothetical protein LBK41_01765 [Clostridiales bacterium]|jgi:hypothetical protein|nr:hypothetical protein [Clostridiales bacterium]